MKTIALAALCGVVLGSSSALAQSPAAGPGRFCKGLTAIIDASTEIKPFESLKIAVLATNPQIKASERPKPLGMEGAEYCSPITSIIFAPNSTDNYMCMWRIAGPGVDKATFEDRVSSCLPKDQWTASQPFVDQQKWARTTFRRVDGVEVSVGLFRGEDMLGGVLTISPPPK